MPTPSKLVGTAHSWPPRLSRTASCRNDNSPLAASDNLDDLDVDVDMDGLDDKEGLDVSLRWDDQRPHSIGRLRS